VSSTGGGVAVREAPPQLLSKGTISNAESSTANRRETILLSLNIVIIGFLHHLYLLKALLLQKQSWNSCYFALKKHIPLNLQLHQLQRFYIMIDFLRYSILPLRELYSSQGNILLIFDEPI